MWLFFQWGVMRPRYRRKFREISCLAVGLLFLSTLGAADAAVTPENSGTPTLVQHVLCSNSGGYNVITYDCKLPNATLGGNAVIVAFQYADGEEIPDVTVSDDAGNRYTSLVTHTDGNQIANIFGAFNVASGARAITLTFNGESGGRYVSAMISEFYNVANTDTFDAGASNNGNGETVTAGMLHPSMNGDLIYQFAINDDPGYCDYWTQGDSPWELLSADWLNGQADQYQVQTTSTAIDPTLTQGVRSGTSGSFNSVAVALKPAFAGTPPGSGIRVVHLQHNSFVNITNFSSDTQGAPTIEFPSSGNLLVLAGIMLHPDPLYDVSTVFDSAGNTWSDVTTLLDTGGDGDEQFTYAANATTDTTMTITLNMSTSTGEHDSDVLLFDIAGADRTPLDQMTTANDVQTAGSSFTGPAITPRTANGLCISIVGVDSSTVTAVTPGTFLSSITEPEAVIAPNDNNNGWSVYYNPDTNSFSSEWANSGDPVGAWGTIVSCFEAAQSQQAEPPTVYIDAPAQGSTVSSIVTVSGWTVDNASEVGTGMSSVKVQVDGEVVGNATYGLSRPDVCGVYPGRPGCPNVGFSFSLNTSSLTPGTHTITVTATDSDATPDTGSFSVTLTVQATPPTVWIDGPTQGSTVSGTVTVVGWAIDNASSVGTAISSVQVKVDGTVVGTATYGLSRPDVCAVLAGRPGCPNVGYSYSLDTSSLSPGSHNVTVAATDSDVTPDAGSSSVTVNVQNPPPTVDIDTPTPGSTVSGTVAVSGWALDNSSVVGTAISSVQVKVDGTVVGTATYGFSRPDVCAVLAGRPGCPNVGYSYSLDTSSLSPGSHTITVTATDSDGSPDSGSASVSVTK
jgi:Bacterial Ig domain